MKPTFDYAGDLTTLSWETLAEIQDRSAATDKELTNAIESVRDMKVLIREAIRRKQEKEKKDE